MKTTGSHTMSVYAREGPKQATKTRRPTHTQTHTTVTQTHLLPFMQDLKLQARNAKVRKLCGLVTALHGKKRHGCARTGPYDKLI